MRRNKSAERLRRDQPHDALADTEYYPNTLKDLIRYVNSQLDPATPTLKSGSYALNMILKKVKGKLESLEGINRCLETKRYKLEEIENGLTKNYQNLLRKEAELEEREKRIMSHEFTMEPKVNV
jgi:translation initiation factor 2B subunit (eIF-2B alpha/beta/delta family)